MAIGILSGSGAGALTGAGIGALAGLFAGPVGIAIGAAVGGVIGAIAGGTSAGTITYRAIKKKPSERLTRLLKNTEQALQKNHKEQKNLIEGISQNWSNVTTRWNQDNPHDLLISQSWNAEAMKEFSTLYIKENRTTIGLESQYNKADMNLRHTQEKLILKKSTSISW